MLLKNMNLLSNNGMRINKRYKIDKVWCYMK